jgi:hypothetical protein
LIIDTERELQLRILILESRLAEIRFHLRRLEALHKGRKTSVKSRQR